MVNVIKRLSENGYSALLGVISGITALFAPAIPIIITVFVFVFVDMYYDYKVQHKYGKHKLESNKLWETVWKLRDCFISITLGLLLDKYILLTYEDLAAVKIAAGAICAAEGLSLLGSFRALHPNAILSKLLSKVIKSKAEKYLDVDLSDVIDIK